MSPYWHIELKSLADPSDAEKEIVSTNKQLYYEMTDLADKGIEYDFFSFVREWFSRCGLANDMQVSGSRDVDEGRVFLVIDGPMKFGDLSPLAIELQRDTEQFNSLVEDNLKYMKRYGQPMPGFYADADELYQGYEQYLHAEYLLKHLIIKTGVGNNGATIGSTVIDGFPSPVFNWKSTIG